MTSREISCCILHRNCCKVWQTGPMKPSQTEIIEWEEVFQEWNTNEKQERDKKQNTAHIFKFNCQVHFLFLCYGSFVFLKWLWNGRMRHHPYCAFVLPYALRVRVNTIRTQWLTIGTTARASCCPHCITKLWLQAMTISRRFLGWLADNHLHVKEKKQSDELVPNVWTRRKLMKFVLARDRSHWQSKVPNTSGMTKLLTEPKWPHSKMHPSDHLEGFFLFPDFKYINYIVLQVSCSHLRWEFIYRAYQCLLVNTYSDQPNNINM